MFRGWPYQNLAKLMASAEPIVRVSMILISVENARLPGYRVKNEDDWSIGCEPKFHLSCNSIESRFLLIHNAEFYGYDSRYFLNSTYNQCEDLCLKLCNCKGFQYTFDRFSGTYSCYLKTLLVNGYISPGYRGSTY